MKQSRLLAISLVGAVAFGIVIGSAFVLVARDDEASGEQRPEFRAAAEFYKRGREDFKICVSDYTDRAGSASTLADATKEAIGANKDDLWKGTFLEFETVKVESPCPAGPTFTDDTADVMEFLDSIPVVDSPGPYILYVHVVPQSTIDTLDRLKPGRILVQEFVDPDPNQPGGLEEVAAALFMTNEEFAGPAHLARQIAEALGCTEGCGPPAEAAP